VVAFAVAGGRIAFAADCTAAAFSSDSSLPDSVPEVRLIGSPLVDEEYQSSVVEEEGDQTHSAEQIAVLTEDEVGEAALTTLDLDYTVGLLVVVVQYSAARFAAGQNSVEAGSPAGRKYWLVAAGYL